MGSADTIFALASGVGRAGIAVIRLSGPAAKIAAVRLVGEIDRPRHAHYRKVTDPHTGELIDQGLVILFKRDESFTGEEVVELQLHGSPAVVKSVLNLLGGFPDCRLAEPGEFTRRALGNGCMDLVQVEGLADLIEAETIEQRRQAVRSMEGELSSKTALWREKLLKINSLITATIDFSDEELPDDILDGLTTDIELLADDFSAEVAGLSASEIIRNGFEIAIVGKPNVGKSTLLNTLAGRDVAITSEVAGTTRDVIEVQLDLGGFVVTLLDTAGIRDSDDQIENIGITRARNRATEADLRIFLLDEKDDLSDLDVAQVEGDITVFSKSDLKNRPGFSISAKTLDGIDVLLSKVTAVVSKRVSGASSVVRQRQADDLDVAADCLRAAVGLLSDNDCDIELVSESVRNATLKLDHLVGRVDVEHILGEIFSSFCIGK